MQYIKRRSSIPYSRRSSLQSRPRHKTPEYSHINIKPAPAEDNITRGESEHEDFVCNRSLQSDIQEGIVATDLTSKSLNRPRTFAEATMSTTHDDAPAGRADEDRDGLPPNQLRLESIGTFKYTFKKKKKKPAKWSPLDLNATDTGSELGSMSDLDSRPVSPTHEPSSTSNYDKGTSASATPGAKTVLVVHAPLVDTDPTPTQARFDLPNLNPTDNGLGFEDFSDAELSDTQSTKDRTEAALAAMARSLGGDGNMFKPGDDPFDSMEWSVSLPPAHSPEKSPPPLVRKPQPVAYTTVGSVVDPTVVPQFTAPNRIQREGASRRPLMMPVHNRPDPYYRSGTSSSSMQNAMHYTQQQQQTHSPGSYSSSQRPLSARSSRSSRWKQQQLALTDVEKQVLARQGLVSPQVLPENIQPSPGTPTLINRPYMRANAGAFQAPRVFGTRGFDESTSNQGPVQGLEKMQTLQRLAKYDNPVQEMARSRLSEFSVGNTRPRFGVSNGPPPANLSFEALLRAKKPLPLRIDTELAAEGSLSCGYQLPQQHSANPSSASLNPLFRSYSPSNSHSSTSSRPPPSTYPQPLTAGPPGQRQYLASRASQNAAYLDSLRASEDRTATYNSFGNAHPTSSWPATYQNGPQQPVPHENPAGVYETIDNMKCSDTLPLSQLAKYYPCGFAKDMTGKYIPPPSEVRKKMSYRPEDEEESDENKKQELDAWFYGGYKRFCMSAEDHMNEAEYRQRAANPLGPIGPPPNMYPTIAASAPCSADRMNNMSTAEAAIPLLDAAFGSLLSYVDKTPGSRSCLSKYVSSPLWQIDASEKGNDSSPGEDWGVPPKRIGRDPRYQNFVVGDGVGFWE